MCNCCPNSDLCSATEVPQTWNGVLDPDGEPISPTMTDETTDDDITEEDIIEMIDSEEVFYTND